MATRKGIDLSALDAFSAVDLTDQAQGGRPLDIPLADIIEDPDQPRKIFDQESLKEFAADIASRGVLMPISVRENPGEGAKYIINSGARRYRGSVIAGKTHIPAFIAGSYDRSSQMAENIHRENLTPLEIAAYIAGEVQNKKKKNAIAKEIGKSNAYVSQYMKLAEAEDWIKALVADGKCSDVTTVNEIIKLSEKGNTPDLEKILTAKDTISRADIQALKEPRLAPSLAGGPGQASSIDADGADAGQASSVDAGGADAGQASSVDAGGADAGQASSSADPAQKPKKEKDPDLDKVIFIAGRKAYLQTQKVSVWWEDTGEFETIQLTDLPPEALEK